MYGLSGDSNASGDDVKKLDVFANDVFKNTLAYTGRVAAMVSEEDEEPVFVRDAANARYVVTFDPLDGSSNIDANVSVGTIFGIYQLPPGKCAATLQPEDLLRPGTDLVAAGYAMYGAATILVLTLDKASGVNGFTLDPAIGEFILTHADVQVPRDGKIFSVNEGNYSLFDAPTRQYIEECKEARKKARYIGSMVADVHRTLLYGGIFMYPADSKNAKGKLRLLYELQPMALLMENAGGSASTGNTRILEILPATPHDRSGVFMGSANDVAHVEHLFQQAQQ
ncbi:MAG: hypothetical protein MHM6MM_007135 [Cercozoa sp. M6MM]